MKLWTSWSIVGVCTVGALLVALILHSYGATTQIPPGEVCFQTSAGPVSSGSLNMYYVGTTTPKATWQDSGQVSMNTQPIQLNDAGCAIIYGVGTYRQQLYDGPVVGGLTTGNLIFDLPTTDTSASNETFWAGSATGTPNAIILTDAGWNSTPGTVINFKAIATNTGPVTITIQPANFTAPLVVDTSLGPVPLTGGEIVQGNVLRLIWDNVANDFVLTNPATSGGGGGGGSGVPIGTEISCPGFNPPSGFVLEYGQLLNRATFATLFAQLTLTQAGTTTTSSQIVSGLTTTAQFAPGMAVEGSGIPAATTIASIQSNSQMTLSAAATSGGTTNITVFAYGNGDGATTFGIPNRQGRLLYGRDNMSGTPAGVLTSVYTTNSPDALGTNMVSPANVTGGGMQITQGYLPAVALGVSIPGGQGSHAHTFTGAASGTAPFNTGGTAGVIIAGLTTNVATLPALSGSTGNMGSGAAISPVSPGQTTNWCIRTN